MAGTDRGTVPRNMTDPTAQPDALTPPEPPPPAPNGPPAAPAATGPMLHRIALTKVTSFVLMTQQRRMLYTGTAEQLEERCRQVFAHNLMLGWWGIPFGLIWTPLALWRNHSARTKLRAALAATPPS